jgi:ubiquinone/menaquinone biosynthesis C-methylase UbiE
MNDLSSNREWIYWGRTDPLFAVATLPGKAADGHAPWSDADFLEMGREYFADVWSQWAQYGAGSDRCVEIGCGSGRITAQLVQHFRQVSAVDVSPDQLRRAEQLLGAAADRVSFACVTTPELPLASGSCDGMFSCEVFQHFDSIEPVAAYLGECGRVIRPGGTICFQLPVRGLQRVTFTSSAVRAAVLRVLRRFGRRRMMMYRRYDAATVLRAVEHAGFSRVELRWFHVARERGYVAYFFATRTASTP